MRTTVANLQLAEDVRSIEQAIKLLDTVDVDSMSPDREVARKMRGIVIVSLGTWLQYARMKLRQQIRQEET